MLHNFYKISFSEERRVTSFSEMTMRTLKLSTMMTITMATTNRQIENEKTMKPGTTALNVCLS